MDGVGLQTLPSPGLAGGSWSGSAEAGWAQVDQAR